MLNLKKIFFLFTFSIIWASLCNAQTQSDFDIKINELDKLINEQVFEKGIPSIAVGIVHNGEVILAKGYGYADVENKVLATGNSIYQIGSVTKVFTGYLLANFVTQKAISLDEPVADFFPESIRFPKSQSELDITIKEIATHSAEFPRYPANLQRIDPNPIRGYSIEEMYDGIEMVTIDTISGTRYNYSNFGYGILGVAIENRFETDLSKLMNEYIFMPYSMNNTSLYLNDSIKKELSVPYLDNAPYKRTEPWTMGTLSGAGNLFSSVSDLNKFMIGVLEINEVNRTQQTKLFNINETWSYGLGCFIVDSKKYDTQVIYHGGDIDGYASSFSVYPEYNLGFVILTNLGEGEIVGETFSLISEFIATNFLAQH